MCTCDTAKNKTIKSYIKIVDIYIGTAWDFSTALEIIVKSSAFYITTYKVWFGSLRLRIKTMRLYTYTELSLYSVIIERITGECSC